VRIAHDGPGAIEEAGRYRPDVILLDLGLPGMSGYDVARRLRMMPDLGVMRLVALTGYGTESDRQNTRDAGFDVHLTKPVDPQALDAVLGRSS
jgi:CheY-like chemotaxis protein